LLLTHSLTLTLISFLLLQLWEKLTGQRAGPGRALAALESLFDPSGKGGSSRGCMTLLVVDEIDVLITKDQSVSSESVH
jgi:origin recognition complex subunit 1